MLKEIITESGERQAVWAQRIGVSEAHLSLILSRKRRPSGDVASRIERVTGGAVAASYWFSDERGLTDDLAADQKGAA